MRFFYFIVFLSNNLFAQNLLADGSFEQYNECPSTIVTDARLVNLKKWTSPTLATPDYYNMCSRGIVGVPKNIAGNAEPQDGKGYIGLAVYVQQTPNYSEYIQTQLLAPLVKDSFYCISFYYRLASYCQFGSDGIGIHLSKEKIEENNDHQLNLDAHLINETPANEQDEDRWVLLKGIYKASGGEQYITLGYFYKTGNKGIARLFLPERKLDRLTAYYYIDNVSIIPISSQRQILCAESTYQFTK